MVSTHRDDVETRKILVLMTDGAVTPQYRPHVGEETQVSRLIDTTPEEADEHDDWIGRQGRTRQIVSSGLARDTQLVGMCNLAKSNESVVYTVAFQLSGAANLKAMKDCATPDQPDQQYYFETSGRGLPDVFQEIAQQISDLRLTQ